MAYRKGVVRLFLVELKRCFSSKGFKISLAVGLLISLMHTWEIYGLYREFPDRMLLTERYLGADYYYVWHSLYIWLTPILAALPYASSFLKDRETGYWNQLAVRSSNIYIIRYMVIFLSGVVTVLIPLVSNIILVATFLPVGYPQAMDLQTSLNNASIMGNLHFTSPLLYTIFFWIIIGLFGGLFACVSLSLSSALRNSFNLMIYPTFVLIFWNLIANQESITQWGIFNMIDEGQPYRIAWKPIIIVLLCGYLVTFTYFTAYKRKKDILEV